VAETVDLGRRSQQAQINMIGSGGFSNILDMLVEENEKEGENFELVRASPRFNEIRIISKQPDGDSRSYEIGVRFVDLDLKTGSFSVDPASKISITQR